MTYKSCKNLALNYMWIRGELDQDENALTLTFCCEKGAKKIAVPMCDNPDESFASYLTRKYEIINESKKMSQLPSCSISENEYYKACEGCRGFQASEKWTQMETDKIHHITFGINPAPCQAKCIYCNTRLDTRSPFSKNKAAPVFDLYFKHLKHFKEKEWIADDVTWTFGAGEITIHPFRKELYGLVGNNRARWLTNCFIYDNVIGDNLHANPCSELTFSIDAGTSKTWHKIKGVDNFAVVKENVIKYVESSKNPAGQIFLKYLILPGVNDDIKNFSKFVEFAKILKLKMIGIARDIRILCSKEQIQSAAILTFLAKKEGLQSGYDIYTSVEIVYIHKIANEMYLRERNK